MRRHCQCFVASITSWQHFMILRFHINMRVMAANSQEDRKFAKWVLNVGDDNRPAIA
jgi:hypothetical protein